MGTTREWSNTKGRTIIWNVYLIRYLKQKIKMKEKKNDIWTYSVTGFTALRLYLQWFEIVINVVAK